MASRDPRVKKIGFLAEKQMKSTLHAHFLEKCSTENIIPNGFRLKLKVNVGSDSDDLQKSVDSLLMKVSHEICDRVRDFHLKKSRDYGHQIEENRDEIRNKVTTEELLQIDSLIHENTEKKKAIIEKRHEKKLATLMGRKSSLVGTNKSTAQQDNPVTSNSGDDTDSWTVVTKKRKTKGKRKNFNTNRADFKSSKKEDAHNPTTQSNISTNSNLEPQPKSPHQKNEGTPGTKKSYLEAAKYGVAREEDLKTTLETLTRAVTNLISVTQARSGNIQGGSLDAKIKRNGERQRNDYIKFRKERRQC